MARWKRDLSALASYGYGQGELDAFADLAPRPLAPLSGAAMPCYGATEVMNGAG